MGKRHNSLDISQREWMKIEEIPQYVPLGMKSVRTLINERRIKSVKPDHGPLLTRKKWIDEYLESCADGSASSNVDDILKGVLSGR